ncbi:MAG TPA: prephenate dehydratase domain-containing protein [Patescibacteria group bacterium]|nr:prephenate dehydratase domain-containing protein [Patescibacteria group bacterium]
MSTGNEYDSSQIDSHMSGIEAAELHYLGPKASFSHLAAIALTKQGIHMPGSSKLPPDLIEHDGFNGIGFFISHDPDHTAAGLLPLEDPDSEPVNEVQTALFSKDFVILGETRFLVRYVLAGVGKLGTVKHVRSHFKGITRGARFINELDLHPIPTSSTSAAAREVAELGDPEQAALCSLSAAQLYGLNVLTHTVGWDPEGDNRTTFVIIRAHNEAAPKLQLLESYFRPNETALVTGIVAPKAPMDENGLHFAMRYLIDASNNQIVPRIRGSRSSQAKSVGGDAEYLMTFKGPASVLHEALSSEEFKDLTRLKRLGIYPVATYCEEPIQGLYPDGPPIDLPLIERQEKSVHTESER